MTTVTTDKAPIHDLTPEQALISGRGRHLNEATLIDLFLKSITGREQTALSATLSSRFTSLATLLSISSKELTSVEGIGIHIIPMLQVLKDASLRYNKERLPNDNLLNNENKLLDYLTSRLARENIEQFRVLFLNERHSLIKDEAQARGTVNHTPVYPREVARRAMELDATEVVLVHNHPSGDPTPSEADLIMTKHVKAALDTVGTRLVDHFIIGNGQHISFKNKNLL
ncbi:RadC family protein [Neokomagataea thailandica]|uniref:DNA repair protein RadC n=1 Tax=Neokomagataea tanensis NBRC 106556 TaxID=1223519 RepID=A0ABQ0QK54_9PROT|nr:MULTISPECIES: DNA repair protein RadC [Neokomagataea]GBR47696.1 DNA repair protein RadC [Neokomagataea tanensis NBRC 106556]